MMVVMTNNATLADVLAAIPAALDVRAAEVTGNVLARQIRADLATAVKMGLFPKGTKFSVKQNAGRYYSSSVGSLTVSIAAFPGAVHSERYVTETLDGTSDRCFASRERYSESFRAALDNAERIANRHNFNNSRIEEDYFHVGYFLSVHGGKAEAAACDGLREEAKLHAEWRSQAA